MGDSNLPWQAAERRYSSLPPGGLPGFQDGAGGRERRGEGEKIIVYLWKKERELNTH